MATEKTTLTVKSFLKPYLLAHKFAIFIFLVTSILATLETGLQAYFFKLVVDTITNTKPTELLQAVLWPALFYVGMELYHNINMRAYSWGMLIFYPQLKQSVMQDLFAYTTKHSVSFFQNNLAGDIASKIQDVTESTEPLIRNVFEIFIARIAQPFVVVVFLLFVGWEFSAIFIVWTAFFVWITFKLSKPVGDASHQYSKEQNHLVGRLVDVLGNIITTKMFGRIQFEHESLSATLHSVKKSEQQVHAKVLRLHFVQGFLSFVVLAAFMSLLIFQRIQGTITVGDFVLALTLLLANLTHVYALGQGIGDSMKNIAKFRQAINVLMLPHDIKDQPNAKPLDIQQARILLENVHFHYVENKPIFSQLNLCIEAGEKVGIVGSSGAGKSTFVNLLLRLIEPQDGSIQINNINIKDVTLNSLRNQITLVPQQIDLFHRSILDNIRYGYLEANEEQIKQAAMLAECDQFIQQLPEGYNTLVGERGMKLSGGQKQRIAIARAYLKPAKILILDEATASLDAITETYIQNALSKIMQDKTTLIIAHRLATLKQMDRILVFDNGKIVQDGTLNTLINQPGKFSELWQAQYFMDSK